MKFKINYIITIILFWKMQKNKEWFLRFLIHPMTIPNKLPLILKITTN